MRVSSYSTNNYWLFTSVVSLIEAICELEESVKKQVFKLILLHLAENPLYSVRIMDWLKRRCRWEIYDDGYFLKWESDEPFLKLIWDWKWCASQFRKDLRKYSRLKEGVISQVKKGGVPYECRNPKEDILINPKASLLWATISKILIWHRPSRKDIEWLLI